MPPTTDYLRGSCAYLPAWAVKNHLSLLVLEFLPNGDMECADPTHLNPVHMDFEETIHRDEKGFLMSRKCTVRIFDSALQSKSDLLIGQQVKLTFHHVSEGIASLKGEIDEIAGDSVRFYLFPPDK